MYKIRKVFYFRFAKDSWIHLSGEVYATEGMLPWWRINDREKASNKESIRPKEKQRLLGWEQTRQALSINVAAVGHDQPGRAQTARRGLLGWIFSKVFCNCQKVYCWALYNYLLKWQWPTPRKHNWKTTEGRTGIRLSFWQHSEWQAPLHSSANSENRYLRSMQ